MSDFTPSQFIPQAEIDGAYDDLHAERDRLRAELDAIKAELARALQMIKLGTEGAIRLIDIEDERDNLRAELDAAREALEAFGEAIKKREGRSIAGG